MIGPGADLAPPRSEPPRSEQTTASIARRVMVGTGWLMGWRMITRLLGFASVLILAQLLVPADFGIVALATSLAASIDGLSQLGVRDALVRLHDDRREYYDTAFTFQIARGLLTGAILAAVSSVAAAWLGEPRLGDILLILAALAAVSGCENIGVVTFTRDLDFRMQVMLQAGPRLLGFAVTTTLAFLLRSYWALIWGMCAGKLIGVALSYVLSPRRPRLGLSGWRYFAGFSFWRWAGSLAVIVWTRSDPFLLGPALGTALLGVYMLAAEIATLPVTELIEPVTAALFPGFALARRNGTEPVGMGLTVAGSLALCAIPFAVGISACSGYLVAGLLGPRWDGARPVIAALAWLCVFSPFSYVCGSVLSAQGQVRRAFTSSALAAVVKVLVLLLVRQTHDLALISAAAVAVVGIESSVFIWQLRAAGRVVIHQLGMTMLRAMLAAAVTAAILFVLPGTWQPVTLGRVAALAAGGAIGIGTFIVFAASQATFWVLAGRPRGAEARLAGALDLRRSLAKPLAT